MVKRIIDTRPMLPVYLTDPIYSAVSSSSWAGVGESKGTIPTYLVNGLTPNIYRLTFPVIAIGTIFSVIVAPVAVITVTFAVTVVGASRAVTVTSIIVAVASFVLSRRIVPSAAAG